MELPNWDEINRLPKSEWNPLDEFIYDNEPAGEAVSIDWREKLSALLDYIDHGV